MRSDANYDEDYSNQKEGSSNQTNKPLESFISKFRLC
jgi:hypothetical protein